MGHGRGPGLDALQALIAETGARRVSSQRGIAPMRDGVCKGGHKKRGAEAPLASDAPSASV